MLLFRKLKFDLAYGKFLYSEINKKFNFETQYSKKFESENSKFADDCFQLKVKKLHF